jgi:adenosylhomocysteine nucleosidase
MPCWQGEDEGKTITLVQSGVGKVHAAVATQMLISQFAPEAIFSCGTAGSLDPQYQIGDLIVAESTTQHDYGFILPGKFIPYGLKIETNQNVEF